MLLYNAAAADDVHIKYIHRRQPPAQLRRQAGGQCLGQIMCWRQMFTYAAALSQAVPAATPQVCRRHMRTRLNSKCNGNQTATKQKTNEQLKDYAPSF